MLLATSLACQSTPAPVTSEDGTTTAATPSIDTALQKRSQTPTPQPSPTATPTPAPPTPTLATTWQNMPVGVQMLGSEATPAARQLAYDMGARWAHIYLGWRKLEPENTTPDQFDWAAYDTILADLSAQGFQVIVNLDSNPNWAASSGRGPLDRTSLDEFEQFIGALAQRYHQPPYNLHHYQFYLEPDDWAEQEDGSRGAWGGHGTEYAQMLARAHRAIHAADPDGKVILGGLAYETWDDCTPRPCFDLDFLDTIAQADGLQYIDMFNFHYYDAFRHRWSPRHPLGKALALQAKLPASEHHKPFLCSEIGEVYWQEGLDPGLTPIQQAHFAVKAYAHMMGASHYGLDIPACIWFSFESYTHGDARKFGLLDENGAPLPSYTALQTFTQQLPARPITATAIEPSFFSATEGYHFTLPNESQRIVVWTTDQSQTTFDVVAHHAQLTTFLGVAQDISDGQAGDLDARQNGKIRVAIDGAPLFIHPLTE